MHRDGELFSPAQVTFTRLPRRALRLARLTGPLPVGILAAAVALAGAGIPQLRPILLTGPAAALWAVAIPAAGAYSWRLRAAWLWGGYSLTESDLWVRTGLWTRALDTLSLSRVQVVTVESGPLQRRFNLASVTVATGSYHSLVIHNVDVADAESIRDQLTAMARIEQVAP